MFRFKKDQQVFNLSGIKVGGQPGENPPLLIASMFHNKDRIVTDRKGNFDHVKATEMIRTQEVLSASTGIPSMVAMVANSAEEAKIYMDFYRETTAMPFGIDMWVAEKERRQRSTLPSSDFRTSFCTTASRPGTKILKDRSRN